MKLIDQPVAVDLAEGRKWVPRTVHLPGGGVCRVERVADFWVVRTRWWSEEVQRVYLLLETSRGLIEIYSQGATWFLHRVND